MQDDQHTPRSNSGIDHPRIRLSCADCRTLKPQEDGMTGWPGVSDDIATRHHSAPRWSFRILLRAAFHDPIGSCARQLSRSLRIIRMVVVWTQVRVGVYFVSHPKRNAPGRHAFCDDARRRYDGSRTLRSDRRERCLPG
jgi:hypothetical protein